MQTKKGLDRLESVSHTLDFCLLTHVGNRLPHFVPRGIASAILEFQLLEQIVKLLSKSFALRRQISQGLIVGRWKREIRKADGDAASLWVMFLSSAFAAPMSTLSLVAPEVELDSS
jgi:hypothetical protein